MGAELAGEAASLAGATRAVRECPACSAAAYEEVGARATSFEMSVAGQVFRQPEYTIRRCARCDLYYKSHTLSEPQLDAYYAVLDSAPFEYDGDFPTDRAVARMLGKLRPGSRVLDFGCSTGRMLKDFAATLVCEGVEPNAEAAAIAGRRGIRIRSEADVRGTGVAPFDAIVLADVHEHLPRPVELLEMLASRLAPGGWLVIVTGNADAVRYRDLLSECWYFRLPGHLQMLSERHAAWLAGRLALDLEELHRCSHYETPAFERVRQSVQAWLYHQFRMAPARLVTSILRRVPRLRDAERWPTAPALTHTRDHVVVRLRNSLAALPTSTSLNPST